MAKKRKQNGEGTGNPPSGDEIEAGYILDFISGEKVRATPEEVHSIQVFSRRLVEDFGYPVKNIITRPQYRVKRRPSEVKKSYPVDIAVFSDERKHEEDLLIVVEGKAPNIKAGRKQLEDYLTFSAATIGVWFNGTSEEGSSHLYLKKDYVEGGRIVFTEIPTLPRYGQRLEDIGLYLRRDLAVTEQLKTVLRDIRNHLAGNVTGITRDEELARQIINILFCKVFDETNKGPDELMDFRAGLNENPAEVRGRILELFGKVKARYNDVFSDTDAIGLDAESLAYVVGELQPYGVTEAKRDVIGDAFEVFMGPALRGEEGREQLSYCIRSVDEWLRGENGEDLDAVFAWEPSEVYEGKVAFLRYRSDYVSFVQPVSALKKDILLPKYYDPTIEELAEQYAERCDLVTVGDLIQEGAIGTETGDEIGRMNYGSGDIPFVRTSDLASWELKREPKQGVGEDVYALWKDKQEIKPGDILLIRDGTYLVGSSILLFKNDLPLLYCGGIYKVRALKPERMDSDLLFALLNLPFVRKQMRNKQFTRDVIDTLGKRITEVLLPIPKDAGIRKALARGVGGLVAERDTLRHRLQKLVTEMYPAPEDE